jgi:hypothetical protein
VPELVPATVSRCEYFVTAGIDLGMQSVEVFMAFATLCDFGSYMRIE